jgi:hypothetical protein
MIRHVLAVGALAGALLFMGGAPRLAEALPVSLPQAGADGGLTLVRGPHGGFSSGGVRTFSGGIGHPGIGHGVPRFSGGIGHGVPRYSGGSGFKPHFRHHGGHGGHGHHRRGRGIRFYYPGFYGYSPYYYDDYYSYDDQPCGWLRRKAVRTNSRYWWRRYERCLRDYD